MILLINILAAERKVTVTETELKMSSVQSGHVGLKYTQNFKNKYILENIFTAKKWNIKQDFHYMALQKAAVNDEVV